MTNLTPEQLVIAARSNRSAPRANGKTTPSAELADYVDGVTSGRIFPVELPWPRLHALTYALLPGSLTVICGDPGVGKTYLMLDCLRFWTANNIDAAVYFLEEDRKFYLRRLLAQEEGRSDFSRIDWWKQNAAAVGDAMKRNADTINAIGSRITVAEDLKQMELRKLTIWLENELKSGRRVIAIDPITAAYAGAERWLADDKFVMETKALVSRYGASLILVTHPRKGNVIKKTGHDMGGGAAYFRFSSTTLWLNRLKSVRRFDVFSAHGPSTADTDTVIEIHKARESKGTGQSIAMGFGDGLHFSEHGVVLRESDEEPDGQPERSMNAGQADAELSKLTKLYPLKLNQAQGEQLKRAFQRVSVSVADRAIDAQYREDSNALDVSKFMGRLTA